MRETVKTILCLILAASAVCLCVTVLVQKKREGGLGTISGSPSGYWKKSMGTQGKLEMITRIFAAAFILASASLYIIG